MFLMIMGARCGRKGLAFAAESTSTKRRTCRGSSACACSEAHVSLKDASMTNAAHQASQLMAAHWYLPGGRQSCLGGGYTDKHGQRLVQMQVSLRRQFAASA